MSRSRRQAACTAMKESCTTSSAAPRSPSSTADSRTSERYSVPYIATIARSASDVVAGEARPQTAFTGGGSATYVERAGMASGSEQAQRAVSGAAHRVVVQGDAADAAVLGQHPCLRPDLLGGQDPPHRGQPGIAVEQVQVARELLHAVDLAAALDLDGHAGPQGVPAHQVDRADRGGVFPADQPPALAEHMHLRGQQLLEVGFDAVLPQAGVGSQVERGVTDDLLDLDGERLAGFPGHG